MYDLKSSHTSQVLNAETHLSECRMEVLPAADGDGEEEEVATLTFECEQGCQMLWPNGSDWVVGAKVFACRSDSLAWEEETGPSQEGIWPECGEKD